MLTVVLLFAAALAAQQPTATQKPELPVLKAGLGGCAADFTVKDEAGAPVYLATIHARIRYGFASVKRMDIEVGTNSEGKARIEGLPEKAKPLAYEIAKDLKKGAVEQNVTSKCQAAFDVTLK